MRQFITIVENMKSTPYSFGERLGECSFDGVVYHCSPERFDQFRLDPERGVYFSNEPDSDYGEFVYECRVRLNYAIAELSEDVQSPFKRDYVDYDGRIVDYSNEADYEMYDVIAFDLKSIRILSVTEKS